MALLGRDTSISGPLPKGTLLLETLAGMEVLGRPYKFTLGLLSTDGNISGETVLGQPLTVSIKLDAGGFRYFHGVVTLFAKIGISRHHTRYRAIVQPTLTQFAYTRDSRVFNEAANAGQNALKIVTDVLSQRGLTDVDSGALGDHTYRKREYCVQYRESDLHFVQRLLEEEGIYYFFKHEDGKHTLVLADSISAHATVPGYEEVSYFPKDRKQPEEEHFWSLEVSGALYPGQFTVLRGYDHTKIRSKKAQLEDVRSEDPMPGSDFEDYDYPGGLSEESEAKEEASIRAQTHRAVNTNIRVAGNTTGLGAGDLVTLKKPLSLDGVINPFWSEDDFKKQYLITAARYTISVDQYETGDVAKADEPFSASYLLLDSQIQYRPLRDTDKPRIEGPQTAIVVGPSDHEIWTDKFGRVMVQFDWDRLGDRDEKSSCWVRVAQVWAGAQWGAIHIPRIGHEVIVEFLDGDPDRPIITGRVYNTDNMPPYELPAKMTQSGIKSRSSKGGSANNFNEIRFEDLKGKEELHVQAEKDMSTLVKSNQSLSVGADRSISVGGNESTTINKKRTLHVIKDEEVNVDGNHTNTVKLDVTQTFKQKQTLNVTQDQDIDVAQNKTEHVKLAYTLTTDQKFCLHQGATNLTFEGTNVTLDSAGTVTVNRGPAQLLMDGAGKIKLSTSAGITLECGPSKIELTPSGIKITSPQVVAEAAPSKLELGPAAAALSGATVKVEAQTICSVMGTAMLKLNSP